MHNLPNCKEDVDLIFKNETSRHVCYAILIAQLSGKNVAVSNGTIS